MRFSVGDTVRIGEDHDQNLFSDWCGFIDYIDSEDEDCIIQLIKPRVCESKWIDESTLSYYRQVLVERRK